MSDFEKDALSYTAGDVVAQRYKITGALGRGGFGAVYAAEHTGTGQPMALKMLSVDPQTSEDDVVARFYREARITAGLTDIHTIRVFDVGQADGGPLFMAMEMLRGPTLEKLLRRLDGAKRTMSETEAIDLALPVLQSLSEAHKAGLVHRDLKPANIILAHMGDQQTVVKVLDFGIARTQDSSLTGDGKALGTPAYMAPEQVRGKSLDGRCDIYALGIMLYRCVTGRMPFQHSDPFALAFMHVTEPVTPPNEVCSTSLSPAFVDCVMKALAKSPDDRFEDARDMRRALQAIRGGAWAGTPMTPQQYSATTDDADDAGTGASAGAPQATLALDEGEFQVAADTLQGVVGGGPPSTDVNVEAESLHSLILDVGDESTATPSSIRAAYDATDDEATRIGALANGAQTPAPTLHIDETRAMEAEEPVTRLASVADGAPQAGGSDTSVVATGPGLGPAGTTSMIAPGMAAMTAPGETATGMNTAAMTAPGETATGKTSGAKFAVAALLLIACGVGGFFALDGGEAAKPERIVPPAASPAAADPAATPAAETASETAAETAAGTAAGTADPVAKPAKIAQGLVGEAIKESAPARKVELLEKAVALMPANETYAALLASARGEAEVAAKDQAAQAARAAKAKEAALADQAAKARRSARASKAAQAAATAADPGAKPAARPAAAVAVQPAKAAKPARRIKHTKPAEPTKPIAAPVVDF